MKITGKVYAAFDEVWDYVNVDLNKDNILIEHNEDITALTVNENTIYFERDSLKITSIAGD